MQRLPDGYLKGSQNMKIFSSILEEVFPFVFFNLRKNKKLNEASNFDNVEHREVVEKYADLPHKEVCERLNEEHERGKTIDEKTVKFTVTISLATAMLGTAGSVILKSVSSPELVLVISLLLACSVFYTFSGGLLALGALKTLPTYGYGSTFRIKKNKDDAVALSALVSQEKVNNTRHLRNEAAYQCLRNGFILLLCALTIYAVSPVFKYENNQERQKVMNVKPKKDDINPKNKKTDNNR